MGFIDLHKPLMDLIPDDYKLCIDRDFGYTILTLRHGDRTQCCRIRSDEAPTDKNLKTAIIFMVEQMKREEVSLSLTKRIKWSRSVRRSGMLFVESMQNALQWH